MPIDMSAAKAPPRRTPSRTVKATPPPVESKTLNDKRREGLMGLAQLAQGLCLMTQQYADAATIGQHFPPFGAEIANLADTYDVVAKPIDFLIEIGPFGAVIAAGMPFVLQLLANHKVIDGSRMAGQGIVPPEVLEAQMKAQVAQMQAEALLEQRRAMTEARDAQQAYEKFMSDGEKVAA